MYVCIYVYIRGVIGYGHIAGVASHILSESISLHGYASLFLLHSKRKQKNEAGPS